MGTLVKGAAWVHPSVPLQAVVSEGALAMWVRVSFTEQQMLLARSL